MKIVEIMGGLQLPITNEEADLLKKFDQSELVTKSNLTEREQLLANNLVNKNVLYRRHQDGRIEYQKQTGFRASSQ